MKKIVKMVKVVLVIGFVCSAAAILTIGTNNMVSTLKKLQDGASSILTNGVSNTLAPVPVPVPVEVIKSNNISIVMHKDDTEDHDLVATIAVWAEKAGYDGILIGSIQPNFKGELMFSSLNWTNPVPMEKVMARIPAGAKAVGFINNPTNYKLPSPIKNNIAGEINIQIEEPVSVAGINFGKRKTIITAENFYGEIFENGLMEGGFNK